MLILIENLHANFLHNELCSLQSVCECQSLHKIYPENILQAQQVGLLLAGPDNLPSFYASCKLK